MYTLQLTNGTLIEGLTRLNPSTFETNSNVALNHQLNDNNLAMAVLLDEDGLMADVFIDYTLQSFFCQGGIFHFRIMSIEELQAQEQKAREKYMKRIRRKKK